ncbi:hypothetical protein QFZ77_007277 [Paenibacillus sp. V4I3]|uniref:DUF1835 domain-containing protein n=1 Tax=Paenibacillus sp. V4I3 TaxID=3042305 RepID=UPI0027826BCA|nr:DUF1835 domain-containing protein [Paenibacillus sp. V4I3]MDQ0878618.1 hypothetical protein [Paenibacillus sp. V4I3]
MRTHIVFGASTRGTLRQAFKINQITEQIIAMEDDLMLGPLGNIFLDSVQSFRLNWWEQILNEEDKTEYIPYLRDSYKNFSGWASLLTDDDSLLFWVGDSSTEQTGFMCLLANLPYSIPVSFVSVSQAYYKRYGKFRPRSTGEVSPEKLFPLMEDAKVITPHVWDRYVTNWKQLLEDNGILRIRKTRQVETVPVDYFDREIIDRAKRISPEKFHLKSDGFFYAVSQKQRIDDGFIEWRIRCLIQRNVFTYQGSLASMRLYMLKPLWIHRFKSETSETIVEQNKE